MSTIELKGATVAAIRTEATEIFNRQAADIEAKREEIVKITEALEKKTAEDEQHIAETKILQDEVEAFKQIVRDLEEKLAAIKTEVKVDTGNLVEIVALPPNADVEVSPVFDGEKKAPAEKDSDGFWHFKVSRNTAEMLLAGGFGMPYVLVGPVDSITADGCTFLRHTKGTTTSGKTFWQPVVVEESPDDDDA